MMTPYESLKKNPDYNFLNKQNICLLGYGGSISYGTNLPTSDTDIRGIFTRKAYDIIANKVCDQVEDSKTDTTIYSVEKIFKLMSNCNPNVIELLGLKPEHYLYLDKYGKMILDNTELFLSKIAVFSFGGYANAQLRRLDNKSVRQLVQAEQEQHILNSIKNAYYHFPEMYKGVDSLNLYIDESKHEDYDSEIFIDATMKHYPLRDWLGLWNELKDIAKSYNTLGKRNTRAIEHGKLGKHMMHLVRLYYMAFDILEQKKVITYREAEHDLLMNIRNGNMLDDNSQPTSEFYDLLSYLENRLEYDKNNTSLPEKPNHKKIEELLYDINSDIVKSYLN